MKHHCASQLSCFLALGFCLTGSAPAADPDPDTRSPAELIGIAWLEADTFRLGPVSGQYLESGEDDFPSNPLPRATGQPVQGFSAVLDEGDGSFLVLADNGYGSKSNSADFILTLYRIRPDFRTALGGSGSMGLESTVELSDPHGHAAFKRVAEHLSFPESEPSYPVDPVVREYSLLTGADFDPESFQLMEDGSYWIGDEIGPWMLHFDSVGRLTQPPLAIPGIYSPDNKSKSAQPASASSGGGFAGMARDEATGIIYLMLEKPLSGQDKVLPVYAFDPEEGKFLPESGPAPFMYYPLDEAARAVGAFLSLGKGVFLTLERDSKQGTEARIKRIYRVRDDKLDVNGVLQKELLVDLLDIHDPDSLASGHFQSNAGRFSFSYKTIESLVVLDDHTLGVINDNNYPFGTGPSSVSSDDPGKSPEETVFILLRVPSLH
jgi:hypothetical protein